MPSLQSVEAEDALEHAVTEALDRILSRMPSERRADALRSLRAELERCLSEAPITGAPMDAIRMRARFSAAMAAFDRGRAKTLIAELDRHGGGSGAECGPR
jgi:hypothetical protein